MSLSILIILTLTVSAIRANPVDVIVASLKSQRNPQRAFITFTQTITTTRIDQSTLTTYPLCFSTPMATLPTCKTTIMSGRRRKRNGLTDNEPHLFIEGIPTDFGSIILASRASDFEAPKPQKATNNDHAHAHSIPLVHLDDQNIPGDNPSELVTSQPQGGSSLLTPPGNEDFPSEDNNPLEIETTTHVDEDTTPHYAITETASDARVQDAIGDESDQDFETLTSTISYPESNLDELDLTTLRVLALDDTTTVQSETTTLNDGKDPIENVVIQGISGNGLDLESETVLVSSQEISEEEPPQESLDAVYEDVNEFLEEPLESSLDGDSDASLRNNCWFGCFDTTITTTSTVLVQSTGTSIGTAETLAFGAGGCFPNSILNSLQINECI